MDEPGLLSINWIAKKIVMLIFVCNILVSYVKLDFFIRLSVVVYSASTVVLFRPFG